MIEIWENKGEVARCVNTARPLTRSLDLREEGLAMQATQKCRIPDCEAPVKCRSLCKAHYSRFLRHGDPLAGRRPDNPGAECSISECDRPALARGWCGLHWNRWRRTGDPLLARPRTAILPGSANSKWKGDDIGYTAAHDRVRAAYGSATEKACVDCGKPAHGWSYDHLDPDERVEFRGAKRKPFSVKVEHYQARCDSCHWRVDHPSKAVRA